MKIGILGFAHGHVGMYCAEWQKHPEWDVTVSAGWDHDAARLATSAGQIGCEALSSPAALLARDDIEAVVIASETSLHAELVEQAAAAGKTIILQKPMALTLPEADRIVNAVERSGVRMTLAWQMRVDPQNFQIKTLLHSGEFGRVFMLRRRHGLGTHLWQNFNQSWHVNPALNRDIWADDASHAIDFLYWMLGEPLSVSAEIQSLLDPLIPNDNGVAIFRYPDGTLAEVFCSFTSVAAENTTEIFAEKGTIIQNYGDVPSCNVPRPDHAAGLKWFTTLKNDWTLSEFASPAGHGARIGGLAQPLADFIHGSRPPIATAQEGRAVLRMTLASILAAREGCRVMLSDPRISLV